MELAPFKKNKTKGPEVIHGCGFNDRKIESPGERPKWGSRCEFFLAIMGYTIGIANIWRFPVLCARNGGGAFLIPFLIFMFTCGGPLYYMEVCLGQFSGKSAGLAFECCPLLKGVGYLMVVLSVTLMWYFITIMGWILYYLVQSFAAELPWTTCGNWWNTDLCRVAGGLPANITVKTQNITDGNLTGYWDNSSMATVYTSPALEFWHHNVLRKSNGLEDMGSVQIHMAVSVFVGWVLVIAALIKGVQSLGKVVYVTAIAPYVLLTILFIHGLTLDGAVDGILWFVTTDFEKLATLQVWIDAAIQVFYSLGPTWGGVITMASHNKFHQKSVTETVICVGSLAFTAVFAGLVVFSCIGFMAHEAGISVEQAAKASGPGLAFVAYPQGIAKMPFPTLWAVLFFLMLTTVIFDSAFCQFETVTGSIVDMFPYYFRKRQWTVLVGVALFLYLMGMPFYTSGGIYLFQLADWYVSAFAILFAACIESIMISWIYGADRFAHDIELMTGRKVSVLLRFMWCVSLTSLVCIVFGITIASYRAPDYGDSYVFQPYAIRIGVFLSVLPIIPVFGVMFKELYFAKGSLIKKIQTSLRPSKLWAANDERAKEIYLLKPYIYEDTVFKRICKNLLGDKDTPWI